MANNIIRSKKTLNAIRKLDGTYQKAIGNAVEELAVQAQAKAVETLSHFNAPKSTSQQLSPKEAAYEVGVKFDRTNKTSYVYAPIHQKFARSMYFLEYGAGIDSRGTSHTNGEAWIYPIEDGDDDIHKEIGPVLASQKLEGTAKYSLKEQTYKFHDSQYQWYGITKTSKPVRYMAVARKYIMATVRPRIVFALEKVSKSNEYVDW